MPLTKDNKTVNGRDNVFSPWWNRTFYEPHVFKVDQLKEKDGTIPGYLQITNCQSECDHLNSLLNTP